MHQLFILNGAPYGTERIYNGLRLALALTENDPSAEVTVFLMADAVGGAKNSTAINICSLFQTSTILPIPESWPSSPSSGLTRTRSFGISEPAWPLSWGNP